MDENYEQYLNQVAHQEEVYESDIISLVEIFEVPFEKVIKDFIERRTIVQLARQGTQYLN